MPNVEFPIEGVLRFPLLIIEWILAFLCLEFGLIFVIKYRRQNIKRKYKQDIGFAALFIGFSGMWFLFIIADYFESAQIVSPFLWWAAGSPRMFANTLGYIAQMAGILVFMAAMERYKVYLLCKYLFTTIFVVELAIFTWFFITDLESTRLLNLMFYPVFFLFVILFFYDLVKKIMGRPGTTRPFLKYFGSFFMLVAGYMFTTDTAVDTLGLGIRFVGSVMQLAAFTIFSILFLHLPAISMLDWKRTIENVYLIDKAGVCLFEKTYVSSGAGVTDHLVTSAISMVNSILQEMTAAKDRGISVIKKKGKVITIFSSELVSGAVISKDDNDAISYHLKLLVETFEAIYRGTLVNWEGNSSVFAPVASIVDRTFSGK